MFESKRRITDKLFELLVMTRQYADLVDLKYVKDKDGEEYIYGKFENGQIEQINVTQDSGIAMIRDVVRRL